MFILEIIIGLWRYLMNKIRTNVSKIYTYIHTYIHAYIHTCTHRPTYTDEMGRYVVGEILILPHNQGYVDPQYSHLQTATSTMTY